MWALLVQSALAGPAVGVLAGVGTPLERPTDSAYLGIQTGLYAGYRWSFGPVHLQPEVVARINDAAPASALLVGGSATFLAPVSVGPYAHVGVGLNEPDGTADVGLMGQVTAIGPLALAARLGWQLDAPRQDCVTCEPLARKWLVLGLSAGLKL